MDLFLDANAHVPLLPSALKAYVDFNNSKAAQGNAKSPSFIGKGAMIAMEESRAKIAELIGAEQPGQIVFTNSATQACEWAVFLLSRAYGRVFTSPIEHAAVKQPVKKYLKKYLGAGAFETLSVSKNGIINVPDDMQDDDTFICIHVQNEIGTIQPIEKLGENNFVFSDMTQTPGKIPFNVTDLDVSIAAFGAHKFGGPGGVGFMYLKDTSIWREFGTGSRYYMDIPGTPNVGGIVSTAAALNEATNDLVRRTEKMLSFRDCLEGGLKELGFEIIGEDVKRSPSITFAKMPNGKNALNLMLSLGQEDIHVGLGSACGALHTGGSPLMEALGRPSDGQDYIRISQWGNYGEEEARYFLDILYRVIDRG